jgi:hypothetical protein
LCLRCHIYKKETDFGFKSSAGKGNVCRGCWSNNPYKEISEEKFTFIKHCKKCNKYYPRTLEFFFKKLKAIANDCKKCSLTRNHSYYKNNSKTILKQKQKYYIDNLPKITKYKRKYNNTEMARIRYKKLYQKRINCPIEYLKKNISSRIVNVLKSKGKKKLKLTEEILGCNRFQFYEYLKNTFETNYAIKWNESYIKLLNIDHINPISLAMNEKEVYELNHYTNLQFLYKRDNLQKNNNLDWKLDLTKTKLFDNIKKLNLPIEIISNV